MEDFSEVSSMGKSPEQVLEDDFPIHVACKEGNLKFLEEVVLKATLQQMTQEDIVYGWQPIHWAAFHGQVDVLCGLIRGGIDKDIRTSRYQQAPAHLASFGGHKDTAQVLIDMHADVNSQDSLGETPLHKAARSGNVDMVITFMRGGADMSLCNKSGHTALDMARQHKFERCVTALNNPAMLLHTNGAHLQTALVQNGSSGARMTNGNRHNNGNGDHHHQNGGNNGGGVEAPRKRNCDSGDVECEAMSRTKRMRTEVNYPMSTTTTTHSAMAVHTTKKEPYFKKNKTPHERYIERVQFQNNMHSPYNGEAVETDEYLVPAANASEVQAANVGVDDFITRQPSPGMDMNLHSPLCNDADELVSWGHAHGYGDTAEEMPDFAMSCHEGQDDKPPQSVESCATSTSDEGDGGGNAANIRSKYRGAQARGWSFC